ncbi:MAG: tRNA (N6-isopentenyl adenosine(37)-C2)-methylthiotransferase MiaB, partial [Sphingobacteriia bacterium]|nr:tRNA (N6-isopentenyl adenosine(37)-C2)-methylthiotransferase MiaB [Sphingobacteriia bacterium]
MLGYQETDDMEQADILMINTCHIREKAAEKVFSELGRMKEIKDKRQKQGLVTWMGLAGCVVQALGTETFRKVKYLDFAVGPQSYHLLPEMIAKKERGSGRFMETAFTSDEKFDALPKAESRGVSAFLAIQEGCDNFCTYCVVPYTRGCEYSRDMASVLKEAHQLVDSGAKEIMLLGQNVDCWHGLGKNGKPAHLALLFEEICKIEGLERLRYTTSYPVDISDEVIKAHKDLPKLMPYIHLPIQSGSNAILKSMNRRYTVEQYLDVVDRLRQVRPDIAISSDFIVGFPGESEGDFRQTMAIVDKVQYAQSYSFKYSARAGTPASLMKNQIPESVKKERLALLQEKLLGFQKTFNQSFIGRTLPVLITQYNG